MENQFKIGDVVILKSQKREENPLKMTVSNTYANQTVLCYYVLNGEVKDCCPHMDCL